MSCWLPYQPLSCYNHVHYNRTLAKLQLKAEGHASGFHSQSSQVGMRTKTVFMSVI